MKFSLVLLSNLLLAGAALARPSGADRHAKRVASRQGKPFEKANKAAEVINTTYVEYSYNWAGVALTSAPAGATYTAVSATFNVPTPTPEGSGSYSGSVWVGIDGFNTDTIWQTGIDFTVDSQNGKDTYSYDAWYEWYPQYADDFSDFSLTAGDTIVASVVTSSDKKGTATLENTTTGKSVTITVSVTESDYALEGENAEWIVEAYDEDNEQVNLAGFNEIIFTGAVAKSSAGESYGISSGTIIDMISETNDDVETAVTIVSSSELTVSYV